MPEESLLTPEVRATVGRGTEPVRARLTRRAVMRAMDVYLGHHDGAPADGEAAPGFAIAAIQTDAESLQVPNFMPNQVLISNEWLFERPLVVGEEFDMRTVLADITERFGGQFGYNLTIRTEVTLTGTDGTIAARSVNTMMQYDAAAARNREDGS